MQTGRKSLPFLQPNRGGSSKFTLGFQGAISFLDHTKGRDKGSNFQLSMGL